MTLVHVHPEVADALGNARPVVALETAVVTAGLPREPLALERTEEIPGWDADTPTNRALGLLMSRTVRSRGAVPATIAVIDGHLRIGLDESELVTLAANVSAEKASAPELAAMMTRGRTAGTTVSATLAACRLAWPRPIEVLATGGIGGVHRGWNERPDISADLGELARTRCCVVCAGAKAVLDVPATLETLETLGVAIVGHKSDRFPSFYAQSGPGRSDLRIPREDSLEIVSRMCRVRWDELDAHGAIILTQPVPAEWAIDEADLESMIVDALSEASRDGVSGKDVTPRLLTEIAHRTGGRSVRANIAILQQNAALAADLAVALTATDAPETGG